MVINCAGPFARIGEPVVGPAIAAGAHYIDSTGEQAYLHRILTTYDASARDAGVAVVPAMGFDFVPGDCIAALAAARIGALESLTIAHDVADWAMSRGTMHTALKVLGEGRGLRHHHGETTRAPARIRARRTTSGRTPGAPRASSARRERR